MNLIPIIYNSLLIFGGLFTFILMVSYIASKTKKNQTEEPKVQVYRPQPVKPRVQTQVLSVEQQRATQLQEFNNIKTFLAESEIEQERKTNTYSKKESFYTERKTAEPKRKITGRYSVVKSNYEEVLDVATYKKSYESALYYEESDKKILSFYADI